MKIFVTGGAGYIGSHLSLRLIELGHSVSIIDNLSKPNSPSIPHQAQFIDLDLSAGESIFTLERLFGDSPEDSAVIHLAALKSVGQSVAEPKLYERNNVGGTRNLLNAIQTSHIRSLAFASSAAVYGIQSGLIDESRPTKPISPYAETKIAEESLIKSAVINWGLRAAQFRFFNVAGAGNPSLIETEGENLIPKALKASSLGEVLTVFGKDYETSDGTCVRDYIHVLDIVEALVLSIGKLSSTNLGVLNLGSKHGASVLQVIYELQKYIPLRFKYGTRRPGDAAILIADSTSAGDILGWYPKYNLEEIVRSSIPV